MENTKREPYSEHQIAVWMESEGLDYLVQKYMSSDHVEDPVLRATFVTAKQALDFIERRLRPHLYENQDYEDDDYCVLDKK